MQHFKSNSPNFCVLFGHNHIKIDNFVVLRYIIQCKTFQNYIIKKWIVEECRINMHILNLIVNVSYQILSKVLKISQVFDETILKIAEELW